MCTYTCTYSSINVHIYVDQCKYMCICRVTFYSFGKKDRLFSRLIFSLKTLHRKWWTVFGPYHSICTFQNICYVLIKGLALFIRELNASYWLFAECSFKVHLKSLKEQKCVCFSKRTVFILQKKCDGSF